MPDENPSALGTFEFPLRFPGQYFDKETSLTYNYFRNFNPSLGRYTESDPVGIFGGLSTYAYVNGNPLSYSDPRGLVRKLSPDSEECVALNEKIQNITNDIARAETNISFNLQGLPLLPPYPGAPPRMSVLGHQQLLDEMRRNLIRRQNEYREKCDCDKDDDNGSGSAGAPALSGADPLSQGSSSGNKGNNSVNNAAAAVSLGGTALLLLLLLAF